MRPFELALFLGCLPGLLLTLFGIRFGKVFDAFVFLVPAILLGLHAVMEGPRLHLTPLYLVAVLSGCVGVGKIFASGPWLPVWAGGICAFCGLMLAGGGFLSGWVFPVFSLPDPAGPYRIGTVAFPLGGELGGRELTVQLWYPAKAGVSGKHASYLPEGEPAASRIFSNLEKVRTHALEDAEAAEVGGGWPVLLYSPSWDGRRFENSALCEALASEGFVVAAIDHPREGDTPPLDFSTAESAERFQLAAGRELDARVSDVLQVFAALPKLQAGLLAGGLFKNKLDPITVGAFGYSFGGAVSAEACLRDPRLLAGANLDGTLFGQAARKGAAQPFLFVTDTAPPPPESELHSTDPAVRRNAEFSAASLRDRNRWLETRGGWLVRMNGVRPANFCDRPLYSRLERYTGAGRRDAVATLINVNACVVAFFNETLRGQKTALLEKNSTPWPGVEIRRFPPPR